MTSPAEPATADPAAPPRPFSSGLSVPGFAACLEMGLRPVGLVQGFCVMQWSWYGAGSPFGVTLGQRSGLSLPSGAYSNTYNCPHGFVGADHRMWGMNYEQPWVEQAWSQGFGSAYSRMVDEAVSLGAHGVIGVVDQTIPMEDMRVSEFHIVGTAVRLDDLPSPPPQPFTTYLAGQRLAKLLESGFMPVSVVASLASVRVWASCMTEILLGGQTMWATGSDHYEVDQISEAHTAVRHVAREHVRRQLGSDTLHGARLDVNGHSVSEGDEVIECLLRGTRVRRCRDTDPLAPPRPTVRLT